MKNKVGAIYILTNPSFPQYVKIGYADDVKERVNALNSSSCIPFAFRLYAYYEVEKRLTDIKIHDLIDRLNPNLRAREIYINKKRKREFYAMTAEEVYKILEAIAEINGLADNLKKIDITEEQELENDVAEEESEMSIKRHHFKDIEFTSSLTGKTYYGTTNNRGTLSILERDTKLEILNNSKPSKRAIIGQAIIDLGGETSNEETSYCRYHKLTKMIAEVEN